MCCWAWRLLIALGFEFVNGFHDTANAVATVIYTHSLEPNIAVVWSGLCNLAGVLLSSGAVAFTVITLLPVELILQVSSGAGFAMVFALLIAAILWNLGTWWFGLPASSSHTMVGSIIGVGVANQLMNAHSGHLGRGLGAGDQGLQGAADLAARRIRLLPRLLFLLAKCVDQVPGALRSAQGQHASAVADSRAAGSHLHRRQLFHGSNDGQKGMGLIMLILIGTVPTAYALNHAVTAKRRAGLYCRLRAGRPRPRPARRQERHARAPMRAPRSPTTSAPSSCSRTRFSALRELVET